MPKKKEEKPEGTRGESIDIDDKWLRSGYEPPKINIKEAIERLEKAGHKTRCGKFSYSIASQMLGLKNSNNISKWFHEEKSQSLSFNTIKAIMWLLNCNIEDLIEKPKKLSGGNTEGMKRADDRLKEQGKIEVKKKQKRKARV